MVLFKNSPINILLPESPTETERFAAEELARYIKLILSADSRYACAPVAGEYNFIIGGPGRNTAAAKYISSKDFGALLTGEEGIFIDIGEETVILAGSDGKADGERGTLYAVYEFLERYAGCAFAAYSHPDVCAGEVVPTLDTLALPCTRYVKAGADRPYRTAIIQYGECAGDPEHSLNVPFIDWLAKNRYNRVLMWASIYEGYKKMGLLSEIAKRGISISVGHHESQRYWLPFYGNEYFPECYAVTHPEYYRLLPDGTRNVPASPDEPTVVVKKYDQWMYCSRNTECIERLSRNLIHWIDLNPLADTVAFWPNDGMHDQCCCEECAKYSKAENYTYFQNEVAKRVAAQRPKAKIDMLVYVDLWKCPEGASLSPNLIVDEAAWGKEQRKCGKADGSCIIGTEFDENLAAWRNAGALTVYYDYYMGVYGNRQRVIPMADEIQAIWRHFAKEGILGAGTQIECYNLWNHIMNLYTFGRTAYDASLSFEDNLRALCTLFGEGGRYVAEAVRMMEAALDGQEIIGFAGKYMIEHIDKDAVYSLFEKALCAASDTRSRNNIRLMRMAFRYSDIETHDSANVGRTAFGRFQEYDDPTGELAYMAVNYDSFLHCDPGYGIAFPVTNKNTKGFTPDKWYDFE